MLLRKYRVGKVKSTMELFRGGTTTSATTTPVVARGACIWHRVKVSACSSLCEYLRERLTVDIAQDSWRVVAVAHITAIVYRNWTMRDICVAVGKADARVVLWVKDADGRADATICCHIILNHKSAHRSKCIMQLLCR